MCYTCDVMNTRRLNIKIDSETHKLLKVVAAQQDSTLQELIIHLIKQMVYQAPQER